ncbi:MAG: VTT domain-containing protein [Candidatus Pacearchaeota archaeon]
MIKKEQINSIIGITVIILFFITTSYIVQQNLDITIAYFDYGYFGMVVYVLLTSISIVIVPVNVIPLMPLASGLWGWFVTGILSVIGWTIGAVIAFLLARHYGVELVKKLIPIEKIHKFERLIPEKNLFFTVIFLRMVVPVDGLSYLLGLFSRMSLISYTLATFIGLIPFSFIWAYAGTLPLLYQLFFLVIAFVVFIFGVFIANYRKKLKEKREKFSKKSL